MELGQGDLPAEIADRYLIQVGGHRALKDTGQLRLKKRGVAD